MQEPLWTKYDGDGAVNNGQEVLDVIEYHSAFPWPMDREVRRPQVGSGVLRIEATRDTAVVIMNTDKLVDAFFDTHKWAALFPSIVSSARTIQVITSGTNNDGNGRLHLMYAELQFPSPLVSVREIYFFRYCRRNAKEGSWTIVDFSFDGFRGRLKAAKSGDYRKRPSGCLLQDMHDGCSKVTWVELIEVEDRPMHPMFDQFVQSGMAFSAQRWLSILQLQCERLSTLTATSILCLKVIPTLEGAKSVMDLSQRMVRVFFSNICSSPGSPWMAPMAESVRDTVRISTRRNTDQAGQPAGDMLCAVATTWLPYTHEQVFELLADANRRSQLNMISGAKSLQKVEQVAIGPHLGNCISLLLVNAPSNISPNVELMVQESSTHPNGGSFVIYTSMDINNVQLAINAGETSGIPLHPSGIVILPARAPPGATMGPNPGNRELTSSLGCFLTLGLQNLASNTPSEMLSTSCINSFNTHMREVVQQIGAMLSSSTVAVEEEVHFLGSS